MSFDEVPDYDPAVIEKYVISNMAFFRRWTLNNITLNQLNAIQIEQQMMPVTPRVSPVPTRTGVSFSDVGSEDSDKTATDTSSTVSLSILSALLSLVILSQQFSWVEPRA